jgi:hypothetical protein
MVTLYLLPLNLKIENKVFLIILEQFLFIKIRPTINRILISTSGGGAHETKNAIQTKIIYVYFIINNQYYLVYQTFNIINFSKIFNISQS